MGLSRGNIIKMDVSIIILNYKNKGLIKHQLTHFFKTKTKCVSEVSVVDNYSGDGVGDMVRELFPAVRFIQSADNRGYAAGNNVGIKAAAGRYVLICNPDIVLTVAAVDELVRFMDEHPAVGIAGPKLTNADGTLLDSAQRFPDIWLPIYRRTIFSKTARGKAWLDSYFMHDWDHETSRSVDWLFGACLIVRASALEKVGLLDERFFLYFEDTDWCRRFWKAKYEVWYVATVSVIHLWGRQSGGSPWSLVVNRTSRVHVWSFLKYLWKWRDNR